MNYFDHNAKQQGLPPREQQGAQPDADTVTAIRLAITRNRLGRNSTPVACGHLDRVPGCEECEPS